MQQREIPHLPEPRTCLSELGRSDTFLEARGHGEPIPQAISKAALHQTVVVREAQNGRLDVHVNALNIISCLPDFLQGQLELDRIYEKEQRSGLVVPRRVKVPHLKKVIPFNHAIRETIDDNPRLNSDDLRGFILKTGMGMYHPSDLDIEYLRQACSERIAAMQAEIFTEQALWHVPGVDDIENADTADELDGIDLRCTYEGEDFSIDVKSTRRQEQEAWKHWVEGDAIPFWTGLSLDELGRHFRAKEDQISTIAQRLEDRLRQNLRTDGDYGIVKAI